MLVRKLVGDRFKRLHDCLDDEAGLAAAVCALNVGLIRSGQVNVAEISFVEGLTNAGRRQFAAEGRQALDAILTTGAAKIAAIQAEFPHLSNLPAAWLIMLRHHFGKPPAAMRGGILAKEAMPWPFRSKAEPMNGVRLKTDRDNMGWVGAVLRRCQHPPDRCLFQLRTAPCGRVRTGHADGVERQAHLACLFLL